MHVYSSLPLVDACASRFAALFFVHFTNILLSFGIPGPEASATQCSLTAVCRTILPNCQQHILRIVARSNATRHPRRRALKRHRACGTFDDGGWERGCVLLPASGHTCVGGACTPAHSAPSMRASSQTTHIFPLHTNRKPGNHLPPHHTHAHLPTGMH